LSAIFSPFFSPLGDYFSREQRKGQIDWLAINTEGITTQSHSIFACSRQHICQMMLYMYSLQLAAILVDISKHVD
jgi:hypothetical protein